MILLNGWNLFVMLPLAKSGLDEENAMPMYEYACQGCGKEFETLVRADTVPECPNCHSTELKKLLSVFATGAAGPHPLPMDASPCASCGNFRGTGACGMN
jgi:putative FmdB family regulatory protein